LFKTAWPSGLAPFYPHPITRPAWQVVGAVFILTAITLCCLRNFRTRPYLIVGWLWYLGTLVPVIELVQAGDFSHADRYTYLPSIGVFIMIAWGTADLATARGVPRRVLATASGTALVALTVCAGIQTSYWRDSGMLFRHAIAVGQNSALAFNNVGALALDQGRYDEARGYFAKALDLDRDNIKALANMGVLAGIQDRSDEAKAYLKRVLALDPEDVNTLSNLGRLALNQGRYDEARTYLAKALDLKPDHANALFNLGENFMRQGRYDEAQRCLRKALEMAPQNVDALKVLGDVLSKLGSREEADRCLKKAEELERSGEARKK
jgi:Tfp pilus assembly protein PilF